MADGTSEMVERVARAIEQGVCAACGRPAVGQITPQDCDRRPECRWRPGTTAENARAAIAAMREPTNEQRNRFFEMKRAAGGSETSSCFIDADWECAIDAALA